MSNKNSEICRIAILGCGGLGDPRATAPYPTWTRQAEAWQRQPEAEIVAIADPNEDALRTTADQLRLPDATRFTDIETMFEVCSPDITIISTGLREQLGFAMRAIEHKSHIIVNKPMTLTLADADALLAAAERHEHRQVVVLHQGRVTPCEREMRRQIDAGLIGKVLEIRCCGKGYMGGYDVLNQATHFINTARGLIDGDFASVQGTFHCGRKLATPHDIIRVPNGFGLIVGQHADVRITFNSGPLLTISLPHYADTGYHRPYVLVQGDNGQLLWRMSKVFHTKSRPWDTQGNWTSMDRPEPLDVQDDDDRQLLPDICFAQEMLSSLKENRQHVCNGTEALAGLEAIHAAWLSHFRHGQRVLLPLACRRHALAQVLEEAQLPEPPAAPVNYEEWVRAEWTRLERAGAQPYVVP